MTPVRRILLVAALIMLAQASVLLQASALAASHYSVELAFENPVSLLYTGVDHVFHAGTTLDSRSQLLAYAEYDSFVEGYGAFSVRKGSHIPGSFVGYLASGSSDATTWSYIGAKKLGQFGVGLSLNHTTGVGFTVDTGLSLDLLSALTLSVALRSVELGSDGLVARDGTVSGVEWRIPEGLSLGLGVANLSSPIYRLSVDAGGKAITARCYAIGERNAQMDSGIEVGLKLRGVTLKLGYHLDGHNNRQIAGLGLEYCF